MTNTEQDNSITQEEQTLRRRLTGFGRYRRRWTVYYGLALSVLAGPGTLFAWFLLDWGIQLPPWPLLLLFIAACVFGAWILVKRFLLRAIYRVQPEQEAITIEGLHGRLDNDLIGALQLGEEVNTGRAPDTTAIALIKALVKRAVSRIERLEPEKLLDLRRHRIMVVAAIVLVGIAVVVMASFPDAVSKRVARLNTACDVAIETFFPVTVKALPGDSAIVRGSSITLEAKLKGARRDKVTLVTRNTQTEVVKNKKDLVLSTEQDEDGYRSASHTLENVNEAFTYRFSYGKHQSGQHKVEVGDLPAIKTINYELNYPAYTGQPPETLSGRMPKLRVLKGTSVLISFAATTELHPDLSYVEWRDGSKQAINVNGRYGHVSFTALKPERLEIHLCGKYGEGFEMENPVSLQIILEDDGPPAVQLLTKKYERTLYAKQCDDFAVPYKAQDDFGVSKVKMTYKISSVDKMLQEGEKREKEVVHEIQPAQSEVEGYFKGFLKNEEPPLEPGNKITCQLRATDNNTETGPGMGRSRKLEIVIVRPDLSKFEEETISFKQRRRLLSGLEKKKRQTDLLQAPKRKVSTEEEQDLEQMNVEAGASRQASPSGSEGMVGDYFRLLSQ